MSLAAALPWLAFTAALAAAVLQGLHLAGREEAGPWARRLAWACAGLTVTAFLWLLASFVFVDLSLRVVHLYTSTDLALRWRIAGTWTGQEGSLLLWTAWTALVAALYGWRVHRRSHDEEEDEEERVASRGDPGDTPGGDDEARGNGLTGRRALPLEADRLVHARDVTFGVLLLLLLPMLWAVARQGTFAPTPAFLLQGLPTGNGLNPTLRSPFILIHPPMMFLAYALTTVPAAAAIGHLATGHHAWSRAGGTWARADWMLYTVAMGLGAMWAYVTLNFGGYWAWDPVEVANLLPWLALTLYLHAQVRHLRSGDFPAIGPILALLPWFLTLFSTLSTRSGLWVSVHAFTDPTQTFRPDPLQRFQDILQAEPGLDAYVGLILGTWLAALALWSLRLARDEGGRPAPAASDRPLPAGAHSAGPAPSREPPIATDGAGPVPGAAVPARPTLHPATHTTARIVAVLFGALSGIAFVAPQSLLAGIMETAHRISGGRAGMGLLGLLFAATVLAGLPALLAPERPPAAARKPLVRRIGWPVLARLSVVILGVGLLVLWVWHMAAAAGWSTATYEARVPWLAMPAILGLLVMQGHRAYGNRASLYVTGVILLLGIAAAAAWPPDRGGALLLVTAAGLVVVSVDQVRRVAVPSLTDRRRQAASALLLLTALLDLLFWIDPPSRIGVGSLVWHPEWPTPLLGITASLYALWAVLRSLAGAPPAAPLHVPLLLVALGGYGVAPVLAIVGWALLGDRAAARPMHIRARRNLHRTAVYGIHLAIAMALLGYATTTALRDKEDQVLLEGQSMEVGGLTVTFDGAEATGDGVFADRLDALFVVHKDGREAGTAVAPLVWEGRQGAHFPLPGILRLWDRDLDVAVDRAMFNETAACGAQAIAPAEPLARMCTGDRPAAVEVRASVLPGLDLLWASVLLLGGGMFVLLRLRKDTT